MPPEHISSKEQSFREALSLAGNILILAGAGLSAASGIPTFRDGGGMWRSLDATSLATPDAFNADPSLVWKIYHYWRSIALSAQPNDAHHIISKLLVPEYLKKVAPKAKSCHLVTQNVDGLSTSAFLSHSAELNTKTKKAAIPRTSIVEMHGRLFDVNCTQSECGYSREDRSRAICPALAAADESFQTIQDAGTINRAIPLEELPRCGKCGALARPGVVWFGEKPYHVDEINMLVYKADMILVIGTSSTVHPASTFAYRVKRRGGKVAIFNLQS
ncbi:sirtuin 5 [Moniliophthora roreri]|uniref:Putative DHS-like NAD/FAD-binding domain-containing protein n=1 Tax=Moniliophthora roreri TaxID=221103 RepID=A0A0W0G7H7_MONRR|nr:sirtuin 5 [Moniliophthora roreri]